MNEMQLNAKHLNGKTVRDKNAAQFCLSSELVDCGTNTNHQKSLHLKIKPVWHI